eukprot:snap_masked-scaffold_32-processed-gene-1.16-mRNA-1 protein AED:1.00 eAED:1.00 QI:0/-1/0/0/-1/1/1/0/343
MKTPQQLVCLISFLISFINGECDFLEIDGSSLDSDTFEIKYMNTYTPIKISNAMTSTEHGETKPWKAFNDWKFSNLRTSFPEDTLFRVGPGPYPDKEMTMSDFLRLSKTKGSKEALNIFQYGQVPTSWSLWAHRFSCVESIAHFIPSSRPLHENLTTVCKDILGRVEVPAFIAGRTNDIFPPRGVITHSGLLIGFENSGIDFHKHQDAINMLFSGKKRWFMKVLKNTTTQEQTFCDQKTFTVNDDPLVRAVCESFQQQKIGTFANWLKTDQKTEEDEDNVRMLTCEQKEGEIIFIPGEFAHAVYNIKPSVAMQMQWNRLDWRSLEVREILQEALLEALNPNRD